MTSDDQQFLDLLAAIPQDLAHYSGRIADYIERHANSLASDIRAALDSASWLPDSMRPPRQQSHHFFARAPPPPQGIVEKTTAWVSKNRTTIAVIVAFAGTTAYLVHRRKRAHARKRRAKKFPNGAKKEIVVLACSSFQDPLTRSLALDLERRGYIVYVTVASTEEDSLVHAEAKPDLRPLWMDLTSTVPNPSTDIHPNLEPIRDLMTRSSRSSSPASAKSSHSSAQQNLILAGVIVLPGTTGYPTQPLLTLTASSVIDTVNTRSLAPILTVQQFLPLLVNNSTDASSPSAIVLAYPTISLSLSPPDSLAEVVTTSSISALAGVLRREMKVAGANITISELKLGNFDLGSTHARAARDVESQPQSSVITHWHSQQRAAAQRSSFGQSSIIKGSSAREFHNAVFDALAPPQTFKAFGKYEWRGRKRSSVVFVGSGARLYDIVGKVMPAGLVGWMMGYRNVVHAPLNINRPGEKWKGPAGPWGADSASSESGLWEKV